MTFRRRKRIRGLILVLATAAVLVPAANARIYEGGSTGYVKVDESRSAADYSGLSPQALQALNQRWEKLAEHYQQIGSARPDDRAGVRGVTAASPAPDYLDRQVANLERHASDAVRPDDRGGIRGPAPVETPTLVSSPDHGFDWTDAGIGASAALLTATLLALAAASRRRAGLPA